MRPAAVHRHCGYWAFVVHRVSGIALALFVPVHLYVLGLAAESDGALDRFLDWTAHPGVKLTESLLVAALAAHLAGGLRLLLIELVGWSERQQLRIAAGFGFAAAVGLLYLLS